MKKFCKKEKQKKKDWIMANYSLLGQKRYSGSGMGACLQLDIYLSAARFETQITYCPFQARSRLRD